MNQNNIEITLDQADEVIAAGDALKRLYSNADFKRVFLDHLLTKEPVRLTYLLADANMRSEHARAGVLKDLDTIAGLQSFMRTLPQLAEMARIAKDDYAQALIESQADSDADAQQE